MVKIFVGTRT